MRTNSISLEKLVNRIRAKHFEIPQFQREFVWNESQVRLLVDSIARNYPVGSLLLTEKSAAIPLAARPIDAVIREGDDLDEDYETDHTSNMPNASFVLDGQQRLTSIARVFLNASHKREYYFDLKQMYSEFVSSESEASSDWIKSYAKSKSSPITKAGGRLIKSDIALSKEDAGSFVGAYFEDSSDMKDAFENKDKARRAAAKVNGVFETIRNYEIPYVMLDGNEGVDSICRVFETINSTGTRLTTFDLAVARYFSEKELNLRDLYDDTIAKYTILGESGFDVDGEKILQIILIKSLHENERFIEPTRGKLLSLNPEYIVSNWQLAASCLDKVYKWFSNECGVTPKTSPNQIIFTASAAMFAIFGEDIEKNSNFHPLLKKWFFSNAMQKGSSKASNYQIANECRILFELAKSGQLIGVQKVNITEEEMIRLNKRDNRYRALTCLIRMSTKYDLITGNILHGNLEEHHIFPRAFSKKMTTKIDNIDSICNIAILTSESNNQINDTHPSSYIRSIVAESSKLGLLDNIRERFKDNMMPDLSRLENGHLMEMDGFAEFMNERAALILLKLKEVLGDSLITEYTSDLDGEELD